MLSLKKGKIYLCGRVCNDPQKIYFTLLDLAEEGDFKLMSKVEQALSGKL